jgi:ParB/RepB/Spo0J family partition protein
MSAAVALTAPSKFIASQLLDINAIEPDPHNPRKDFPKEAMNELISSVMLHGVREPIEVRPVAGGKHRIVFGERRWRAAKAAGHKDIPAIVRNQTDLEAADIQLEENLKRAELRPLEVAGGYEWQLELGRTMEQLCERSGRKRTQVYAMLQLLRLGDEGRKALGEERIEVSTAQRVASYAKSLQPQALSIVEGLSFKEACAALERELLIDLRKAPFEVDKKGIACVAESCATCPNCVRNHPELEDVKNKDACLSGPDYRQKVHNSFAQAVEAQGFKMMKPADAEGLFWNGGAGAVDPASGYVEVTELCHDDAQNRPYKDLLTSEQLKKLVLVAIDASATPRKVLERSGLVRELKKGGVFKERRKNTTPAAAKAVKTSKPAEYVRPPPSVDELVDRAVVTKMVTAVEKKGATPAVLRLMVREALGAGNEMEVQERRCWKDLGPGRLSEKELLKATGSLSASQLVGLLFEALVGPRYMNGDGFDDIAGELGIDVKKLEKEMKFAAGLAEQAERSKKFEADVKRATSKKKDPLDSPAVAKAKAKKASAKKPVKKGGRK